MKRALITGMSGVGKSAVILELSARGYRAFDTDYNGFSELVSVPEGELMGIGSGLDWVWREDRVQSLLSEAASGTLFLAGCSPNQRKFYPQFDLIVLLTAPPDVIVERLRARTNNPYGKRAGEIERTLEIMETIEPLLRERAGCIVDTSAPLEGVVEQVLGAAAPDDR